MIESFAIITLLTAAIVAYAVVSARKEDREIDSLVDVSKRGSTRDQETLRKRAS